jgi:polar amino acid transport system permease protein
LGKRGIRFGLLDGIVLAGIGVAVFYAAYKWETGVPYRWDWGVIPPYLFRYDPERGRWAANLLMEGFFTTIRLSLWVMVFATLLGTAMALFRVSRSLFRRMVATSYVELIRNTPPLVLVFLFYFFIGDRILAAAGVDDCVRRCSEETQRIVAFLLAPPARFSAFVSGIITLVLYEGAYITEIVRAGILSVEKGQWEAADALGFSWRQKMRHVILPQAFRRILPPLAGQLISTIKDSAILSVISIQELTFQGLELMAATYRTFEIWITIAVLYFVLTFSCSLVVRRLELHVNRHEILPGGGAGR